MDHLHWRHFTSILVVLFVNVVSSQGSESPIDRPIIPLCWGGNFSSDSPYQANLDALINRLATGAAASGGFFNYNSGNAPDDVLYGAPFFNYSSGNAPDDVIYGAAMCYVDSNWDDCQQCLNRAPSSVLRECPYSMNAAVMYRDCALRYSNEPFFSTETDRGHVVNLWITSYIVDVVSWNNTRWKMMNKLISDAAALPSRFANGGEPYGNDNTSMVYGLVQCRNDLTQEQCTNCLSYQLQYLLGNFPNKINAYANVRGFSCMAKLGRHPIVLMEQPGATPTQPLTAASPSLKAQKRLIIGLTTAASWILFLLILVILFFHRRQKWIAKTADVESSDDAEMEGEFRNQAGPKRFGYDVLAAATGNFSDDRKLGEGGFGSVYKGFLDKLDISVAIKRVSRSSSQGRKEYASEVRIISGLRHRNLVKLIGWCHDRDELLLVYELMLNRSLDKHLYSTQNTLSWQRRYQVILGVGSALLYLHQDCEQGVLHRDIKPSNVMLDASFNAKLGDFGLARLVEHSRGSHTTELAGTMGYLDPSCMTTGKFSTESDIYSFGVVLLEVACGRQPVVVLPDSTTHLVRQVLEMYRLGEVLNAADPRLNGDFNALEMECVLVVGLWCTQQDQSLRPSIRQAISALRFEAPLPTVTSSTPVGPQLGSIPSLTMENSTDVTSSVYRSTN